MTVEEYINKNSYFILNADTPMGDILRKAIRGYATLKCKELLEIVAEKAKIKDENGYTYYQPHTFYCNGEKHETLVDKNSILNAVDLKEFIK